MADTTQVKWLDPDIVIYQREINQLIWACLLFAAFFVSAITANSRPTGYGAVPDYRPPTPGNGVNLAQSSAWRGRWPDITGYLHLGARDYDPVSGRWLSYDPVWNAGDPNGFTFCGIGDPINYFDPSGRMSKQALQAQWRNVNAGAAWVDDQFLNMFTGAGYLLNQGAYLVTGEPGFGASALQYQNQMSPFARQGYYNPNTPQAQLATAATIFVNPQSAAGRLGTVESVATRNVVPTVTRESIQVTETAAVQGGVVNSSTRLLAAPPPVNLLTAPRPITLIAQNAASLAARTVAGLDAGVLRTFVGQPERIVLQNDLTVSRVFEKIPGVTSGSSEIGGRFFTTTPISSSAQAQQTLALGSFNQARFIETAVIPKGMVIYRGAAAPLGNLPGGGVQIFVPDISGVQFYGIRPLQ